MYPPVWSMTRACLEDDYVEDILIPSGELVVVSPYALNYDERRWENPDCFDPERFTPERMKHFEPFSYIPFSGGERSCIGRDFARLELCLVLATVVRDYNFSLVANHVVEPEALVTLRPKGGLPMVVRSYNG